VWSQIYVSGRERKVTSVLTPDEVVLVGKVAAEASVGDRRYFDALTSHEQKFILSVMDEYIKTGSSPTHKALWELDYIRIPVSPEEFINSTYYLGKISDKIYPVWKKEIPYVLDPKNQVFEWILTGSIGGGKTTVAQICQIYKLYFLSCLKDPYSFFNLMNTTLIVFMLFSLSLDKADLGVYYNFKAMLDQSPYFIDTFPSRKSPRSRGRGQGKEEREILFPKGITVLTGSQVQHALSFSVFSAILDEVNFRARKSIIEEEDANSAVSLYEETASRIKSRFMGFTPGILCTVSSKKATTDFIDRHIEKVKDDPHVHISDNKIWDVKPDRIYTGHRFFVVIGATSSGSRVIDQTSEDDKHYRKMYDEGTKLAGKPSDSFLPPNVISVPVEYELDFRRDVNKQLQNTAGIATTPYHLLFDDPLSINRGVDKTRLHPFTQDTIEIGVKGNQKIRDYFRVDEVTVHDGMYRQPKYYPRATRFIHVDLAKGRRDSVGIAMSCISKVVNIEILDVDNQIISTPRPEIFVDFMLRIRAPQGDEVFFEEIRQFIVWLKRTCNYKISLISFDGYNSIDSLQLLQKSGFQTRLLSVDRNDKAYMLLKETILENRLRTYYYPPLYEELKNLIHDVQHGRVDHPQFTPSGYLGAKDVSDGLCGSIKNCTDALTDKKLPQTRAAPGPIRYQESTRTIPALGSGLPPEKDSWLLEQGVDDFTPEITRVSGGQSGSK
jgi:hypothetical protein